MNYWDIEVVIFLLNSASYTYYEGTLGDLLRMETWGAVAKTVSQGSLGIPNTDHIELIAQRSSLADSRTYKNVRDCRYLIVSLYGARFRNGPFKPDVQQIPVSAYLSQIFSGALGHKTRSNQEHHLCKNRKFEKRPE